MATILQDYILSHLKEIENINLTLKCEFCNYEAFVLYERYIKGNLVLCCSECAEDIPLGNHPTQVDDLLD